MYLTTGVVEQVRQTQQPLDQCFETASTVCLQVRSPHIVYTDLCPHECTVCGDLRTSRFSGQRCLEYDKSIKLSKTVTGLLGLPFHTIPRRLETANGRLSSCVQTCSESESCYHGCMRTKAKISSDALGPKTTSEAIVQHQIQKISWGSISLLLCIHTIMFTNAILLPLQRSYGVALL